MYICAGEFQKMFSTFSIQGDRRFSSYFSLILIAPYYIQVTDKHDYLHPPPFPKFFAQKKLTSTIF
jgi:hypothetical protein